MPRTGSDSDASVMVGCDVGGTFTDLILLDPSDGRLRFAKVPTSPANQAEGVLAALAETGISLGEVALIVHGTTATTNAVLERKLARCGLITTRGFRDVLELGRRTRPKPYGLIGTFTPVIPRHLRIEVAERMTAEGRVHAPLDEAGVAAAARHLIAEGAEAVVIHFLHSYANPAHELRAAEIVRGLWPNGFVTAGHEIISEYREYERGVTAAVNGAVQPILDRYIGRLVDGLAERGFARELLIMRGNGGTVSARAATGAAVETVMSGPASGVIAAAHTSRASGRPNVITYDMGGTSTDVALIENGEPIITSELELEYAMPIHVPMVDVHTIGAGGGSIAHIDEAGMLRVGPESAGANPGPICFGRGGRHITITDANLLLGRLDSATLHGVTTPVPLASVASAIETAIARPLGLSVDSAAAAILRVANDRMAGAIRLVSLGRGHDPRDFSLFAFGGAGPLHASAMARELGIPTVLVPARPGLVNAFGCLVADLRHDFVKTINRPLASLSRSDLASILDAHAHAGRHSLDEQGLALERIDVRHSADMQFQGQTHVLNVALGDDPADIAALRQSFADAYWRRFRVALPEIGPVLVNLHSAVVGRRRPVSIASIAAEARAATPAGARTRTRKVWFEAGWLETAVYDRTRLPLGAEIAGPAILEQLDATTVVEPGDRARVDEHGNVLITVARSD